MGYKAEWWENLHGMDASVTENRLSSYLNKAVTLAVLKQKTKNTYQEAKRSLAQLSDELETVENIQSKIEEFGYGDAKATDTARKIAEFKATINDISQRLDTLRSLIMPLDDKEEKSGDYKHKKDREKAALDDLYKSVRKANSQLPSLPRPLRESTLHEAEAGKTNSQADLRLKRAFESSVNETIDDAGKTFSQAKNHIVKFSNKVESILTYRAEDIGHFFDKSIDAIDNLIAGEAILASEKTLTDLAFDILQAIRPLLYKLFDYASAIMITEEPSRTYLADCYEHILHQLMQSTSEETDLKHMKLVSACQLLLAQKDKVYDWCRQYSSKNARATSPEPLHNAIKTSLSEQRLKEAQELLGIFQRASEAINAQNWKNSTWHPCIRVLQQAFADRTNDAEKVLREIENTNPVENQQIDRIYRALACIYHRLITVRVFLEQTDFRAKWSSPPKYTSAVYESLTTLSNALVKHCRDNNGSNMYEFVSVIPQDVANALLQEEENLRRNSQASDQPEYHAKLMKGNEEQEQNKLVSELTETIANNRKKSVIKILQEETQTTKPPISQKQTWLLALLNLFIPTKLLHYVTKLANYATGRQLNVQSIFSKAAKKPTERVGTDSKPEEEKHTELKG